MSQELNKMSQELLADWFDFDGFGVSGQQPLALPVEALPDALHDFAPLAVSDALFNPLVALPVEQWPPQDEAPPIYTQLEGPPAELPVEPPAQLQQPSAPAEPPIYAQQAMQPAAVQLSAHKKRKYREIAPRPATAAVAAAAAVEAANGEASHWEGVPDEELCAWLDASKKAAADRSHSGTAPTFEEYDTAGAKKKQNPIVRRATQGETEVLFGVLAAGMRNDGRVDVRAVLDAIPITAAYYGTERKKKAPNKNPRPDKKAPKKDGGAQANGDGASTSGSASAEGDGGGEGAED